MLWGNFFSKFIGLKVSHLIFLAGLISLSSTSHAELTPEHVAYNEAEEVKEIARALEIKKRQARYESDKAAFLQLMKDGIIQVPKYVQDNPYFYAVYNDGSIFRIGSDFDPFKITFRAISDIKKGSGCGKGKRMTGYSLNVMYTTADGGNFSWCEMGCIDVKNIK